MGFFVFLRQTQSHFCWWQTLRAQWTVNLGVRLCYQGGGGPFISIYLYTGERNRCESSSLIFKCSKVFLKVVQSYQFFCFLSHLDLFHIHWITLHTYFCLSSNTVQLFYLEGGWSSALHSPRFLSQFISFIFLQHPSSDITSVLPLL